MTWDPDTYLAFAGPRMRPALDLVERIPLPPNEVASVVDLGAGAGNLTGLLRDRFPQARLTIVDNDPAMLARAHEEVEGPRVHVVDADIATWSADLPVDVLFSNAALHWVDDHDEVLPRLLLNVRGGGALAIQMPRNHDAPSHRLLAEVVRASPWADDLSPLLRDRPVATAEHHHRLLSPLAEHLDVWTTTYVQHLPANEQHLHPVAHWMSGSTLRPLLAALPDEAARKALVAGYADAVADAYPIDADGSVRFPFTRTFLVACPPLAS